MERYYPSDLSMNPDNGDQQAQFFEQHNFMAEAQRLSSAQLTGWLDINSETTVSSPKGNGRRRRPAAGSDHVKHRRTRSGCYTCRSRRVKCDEQHPICERCKKGSRECVYPEPPSSTKASSGSKPDPPRIPEENSESSSGEYEDEESEIGPAGSATAIHVQKPPKARPPTSSLRAASRKHSRQTMTQPQVSSASTSRMKEKSLSPSTDDSSNISKSRSPSTTVNSSGKFSSISTMSSMTSPEATPWSHLPHDMQYYLDFHQNRLTYHHYFFKHDASHFVNSILLENALGYEPLLYAVIGFAAFQSTLQNGNGKIQDFLHYYNKSVSLLRKSLSSVQKHSEATLITILQLAAFEEYLGDWVNLLGHQKAAFEMLHELYTPQSVIQTEARRKILSWYARFDLYAGLMSGYEVTLSREWFCAYESYYLDMSSRNPDNLGLKIDSIIAHHRLMAMDMALLFAKLPRGNISIPDFIVENQLISDHIEAWKGQIKDLVAGQDHLLVDFTGSHERDPDDIVDPYRPGGLYRGPLWTANYLMMDSHSFSVLHKYQTAIMLQQLPPPNLAQEALEQCRIFETIEKWPGSPPGALLSAQASLGMSGLYLPKDERHSMWCRRKLATIERMGYIYPLTFRKKMAEIWNDSEIIRWWLPDEEGYPSIIRSIRTFIEERTLKPRNQSSEDVRNMKGVFSKMSIFDDSPSESSKNSPETCSSVGESSTQQSPPSSGPIYSQVPQPVDTKFDESMMPPSAMWEANDATGQEFYER